MSNANGLSRKDLERLERAILKQGGDIAESIGRSFERLEERIDVAETHIGDHLSDVVASLEEDRQMMTGVTR